MGHASAAEYPVVELRVEVMRTFQIVFGAVAGILLMMAGCASDHPFRDDPWQSWPTHDRDLVDQRDRLRAMNITAPLSEISRTAMAELGSDTGVQDYVRMALERYPGLLAARGACRAWPNVCRR